MSNGSEKSARAPMTLAKSISIIVISVIVVFILGWLAVFGFHNWVPTSLSESLGQTGDMFGAANALFSALGFAGILIVLLWDARERKRDLSHRDRVAKPFLVPKPATQDAANKRSKSQIVRARWNGAHFEFIIGVNLLVKNLSPEPGINVLIHAQIDGHDLGISSNVGLPVGPEDEAYVELRFTTSDTTKSISAGKGLVDRPLECVVALSYESLSGIKWTSVVTYLLSVTGENLANALKPEAGEYIDNQDASESGGPTNKTDLNLEPKSGSWLHDEVVV